MLATGLRAVDERAKVGEGVAGLVVVVDDHDMVMDLVSATVGVGDDQGVRVGVHPLGQAVANVIGALHVLGALGAELTSAEALSIVQRLHLATGVLGEHPSPRGEHAGAPG